MINNEWLDTMRSAPLESLDVNGLSEAGSIPVNRQLPKELRILRYITDAKNPYYVKVGNNVVRMRFSDSGLSLQNALARSAGRK